MIPFLFPFSRGLLFPLVALDKKMGREGYARLVYIKYTWSIGNCATWCNHFLVEAEVVVAKKWGNRVVGCRREVVKVEELKKTEKKQE